MGNKSGQESTGQWHLVKVGYQSYMQASSNGLWHLPGTGLANFQWKLKALFGGTGEDGLAEVHANVFTYLCHLHGAGLQMFNRPVPCSGHWS